MTDTTADNIVELQAVSKSFGDLKVLDQLNLQVRAGEKLALIGPSGSGKTTILRILLILETIDSGVANIVQPQVLINKTSKPDARQKADELMALVGLQDKKDHYHVPGNVAAFGHHHGGAV